MKIRQIRKTGITLALLVAIILAGFAVSLAQDSSPIELTYSFGFQHSHPNRASTVDGYTLRSGLVPKSGFAPRSFPNEAYATRAIQAPPVATRSLDFGATNPRKIALYLLDSILLI